MLITNFFLKFPFVFLLSTKLNRLLLTLTSPKDLSREVCFFYHSLLTQVLQIQKRYSLSTNAGQILLLPSNLKLYETSNQIFPRIVLCCCYEGSLGHSFLFFHHLTHCLPPHYSNCGLFQYPSKWYTQHSDLSVASLFRYNNVWGYFCFLVLF